MGGARDLGLASERVGDEYGMASRGRDVVGPLVLEAWDAFVDSAAATDLDRPSRLPGWRGHEVCVHLGSWPDYRAFEGMVRSARAGGVGPAPDADAANDEVTRRHRLADRDDVLEALRRHRQEVSAFLAHGDPDLDLAETASTVGPLPLLSVVLGEAYELAVHALDLVSCGAPPPPPHLLQAGLAALADVTGALTARTGIDAGATLHTPDGGWSFTTRAGSWTVVGVEGARPPGAVVEGRADVLLDASAGRSNAVAQLARRRLKVHDLPAMLRLAPVVQAAPGIPGAPILELAGRTLSGVGGLAGRLLSR